MDAVTVRTQLLERRDKLHLYLKEKKATDQLVGLLKEVDSALERLDIGTYGICETCHEPIETEYLNADPLVRVCLEHLNVEQQRSIELDLELAARVQGKLLPSCNVRVEGWEVCYHYEPHGVVSGDYCDFIPPENPGDGLYFLLGDVSGKGVSASLLVFHLHGMFRSLIAPGVSLARVLERANRLFSESTLSSNFATLVFGRASADGTVEIVNAGHCYPLVVQKDRIRSIERSGLPLGISFGSSYETRGLQLSEGDLLVLYSDGVTETFNPENEEYSEARLSALIAKEQHRSPEDLVKTCMQDIAAFRRGAPKRDDITIMAMKRLDTN